MGRKRKLLYAGLLALLSVGRVHSHANEVEILRDPWGIPHIFAETDSAAFYGLGYATAEDRLFQMTYALRTIQGRLAEVIGIVNEEGKERNSLDHDRKMRTFGFYRAAQRLANNLDSESHAFLESYSAGVNAYAEKHSETLHPLFASTGMRPEPWTPADCLASWWHLAQFFATDGTRDLMVARNANRERFVDIPDYLPQMPPDENAAVVKRSDVSEEWIARVERYAREHGPAKSDEDGESTQDSPKFSHAWVVGGKRSTTGSSVLVSDPQTPVRNPSLLYEWHIHGATFNARGVGVAGSPIILIGFTPHVAWGATALGADQADLFRLKTDPEHPDQYEFDGQWRPMNVLNEIIKVKGSEPITYRVRETHLGPVATEFSFATPDDGEVALKRIPICETNRDTIQAAIAIMRAKNTFDFDAALAGWRFPTANLVFGDSAGNIGYRAVGALPVRSRQDENSGRHAMPGTAAQHDWQEILPYDLAPGVMNPAEGILYSANHRSIASWYPIPASTMTGSGGDTVRSWRLSERLRAQPTFTPEEVRAIHFDTVNPARRDIVRLGLHLRDKLKREMSEDAHKTLRILEAWHRAGASSAAEAAGAELAVELSTFFRFVTTDLSFIYGGGETGITYFLKTVTAKIDADPDAPLTSLDLEFIDNSLATAWRAATEKYGDDPATWKARAKEALTRQRLKYYAGMEGFPGLDPAQDIPLPPLSVTDGGTIASQQFQSYTQWVPMHDPDTAESILPIGPSEIPGSPTRTSTLTLWGEGRLHPAPLSREKVNLLGVARVVIEENR